MTSTQFQDMRVARLAAVARITRASGRAALARLPAPLAPRRETDSP